MGSLKKAACILTVLVNLRDMFQGPRHDSWLKEAQRKSGQACFFSANIYWHNKHFPELYLSCFQSRIVQCQQGAYVAAATGKIVV